MITLRGEEPPKYPLGSWVIGSICAPVYGLGCALILLFTQWLPFRLTVSQLSWITIAVCALWIAVLVRLAREYRAVVPVAVTA